MTSISDAEVTATDAPDPRDFGDSFDAIYADNLFDEEFYACASCRKGDRRELILHYLKHGEALQLSPSRDFDVAFYRHANPDVASAGVSPLVHFLTYGRAENRYPNRARLRRDVAKVEKSGLFDHRFFAQHNQFSPIAGLTAVEYYLTDRSLRLRCNQEFDAWFYAANYEDVRTYPGHPLLHFIDVGRREGRVTSGHELQELKSEITASFDEAYYLSQFPAHERPDDPIEHYLLLGERAGLNPTGDFSPGYYLRNHADLYDRGVLLFAHYVRYGCREGRVARPDFSDLIVPGTQSFDLAKPTVIIANHEASRTGAPLVGLTIAAHLHERYNVISALCKTGPLKDDFLSYSCLGIIGVPSPLDAEYLLSELKHSHRVAAILLNSVETHHFAEAALFAGIPSVGLLHEFAEYTLPPGRMTRVVEAVDRVLVPAELIRESLDRDAADQHRGCSPNNVAVRSQGWIPHLPQDGLAEDLTLEQIREMLKLRDERPAKIVLGAGYVQMRKGVDLFVQTAAEMRRLYGEDVRFVWVGSGYDPARDIHYSAWVADMVRRLDLEDTVFFLPQQSSLDVLFDLAHVFYLPSRLDPFPNVVLDAFRAGKPVVCFDRATGVAGYLASGTAHGAVVDYCDVRQAAEAINRNADEPALKKAASNAELVRKDFDFGNYVTFIEEQFVAASQSSRRITAAAERIQASGFFDWIFHDGTLPHSARTKWQSILLYVARGSKGLFCASARPGFSEALYWNAADPAQTPEGPALDRALPDAAVSRLAPTTHRCVILDEAPTAQPFRGRIAFHIHLHYPEIAAEYAERLGAAKCNADVFITTDSSAKALEIAYAFRKHELGAVHIDEVANRGRDIGPFLTAALPRIRAQGYDLIGHFHGKRSLSLDGNAGDRWRAYLVDTLLGERENLEVLLSMFARDDKLGLVFAEDRHAMGWTRNERFAADLAKKLEPRPTLPRFPMFPLGTMFWARPDVLDPWLKLQFRAEDFPAEPAPADGTILHAIERMLPAVCEAAGYSWSTVYRRGRSW